MSEVVTLDDEFRIYRRHRNRVISFRIPKCPEMPKAVVEAFLRAYDSLDFARKVHLGSARFQDCRDWDLAMAWNISRHWVSE